MLRGFFGDKESSASSSDPKIYVTHIMQEHAFNAQNATPPQIDRIAYSQFQIIKEILANPDHMIVLEGLMEDMTPETKDSWPMCINDAHELFSNGIPEKFSELTSLQKMFLAERGGPSTLYFLGKIDYIHKSMGTSFYKKHKKEAYEDPAEFEDMDFSLTAREIKAITCLQRAAQKTGNKEVHVFLIFGALHNFEARIIAMKNKNLVFKDKISTMVGFAFFGTSLTDRCQRYLNFAYLHFLPHRVIDKGESKEYSATKTLYPISATEGLVVYDFHAKTDTVSDYSTYMRVYSKGT